MKRPIAAALLLAPLLASLDAAEDCLAFAPADGTAVAKSFEIAVELELGDLRIAVDGEDQSGGVPDLLVTAEAALDVTDHFVRSEGGRPLELVRDYEEIRQRIELGADSRELDDLEELEGSSVRFTWNEEDGDYDVAFVKGDGDPDLLERLPADLDLRALLPRKEVSEGDTWSVEAGALGELLLFAGAGSGMDEGFAQHFEAEVKPQLDELLEDLEITCRYQGQRSVDDRRAGVIGITVAGEGQIDLTGLIERMIEMEAEGAGDFDLTVHTAALEVLLRGEGELLWDLEGGHFHSFELTGDGELDLEFDIEVDAMGEVHTAEGDAELLFNGSWKAGLR